ncbi:response regulator [Polymorphobacter fuscus]|uniref:Response regulator n=1 Tax=Sandarakinorhabdus fusca TaxID=1439888 RepID=A0A7C9KJT7_9SPHN|nr:response regulator [Polymorphobacter fuscus]KAB7644934.1 response regulator [Polymorphobacter fuscus]MQT18221.1 response regulator [Polymorphobacter fuscus]NJC09544.1 CheY-like chemotaxis protein/DNA-directed RNA polymerase specialized sigma24 family protein [Polymorphobacter fuscus]
MSLASQIAPHLPYLRRYARALTGSQAAGDAAVAATLAAIVADRGSFANDVPPRLALYKAFQAHWRDSGAETTSTDADSDFEVMAGSRLAAITPLPRQALLLSAMEGFTSDDVGYLIDQPTPAVLKLVAEALADIDRQTTTRVLIIEDEPIIALDIETIVRDLGHGVTGMATTADEATAMFRAERPGLVLADIQLADHSSGVDAVRDMLAEASVPVIFITAFPERLLTGERPEPTFLITKPFQTATVKAAIAQALFFNSTAQPGA